MPFRSMFRLQAFTDGVGRTSVPDKRTKIPKVVQAPPKRQIFYMYKRTPKGRWTVACQEILPARILEWVAISCSRGSSRPRDRTHVSDIARR